MSTGIRLAHKRSTDEYMIIGSKDTITNIWGMLKFLNAALKEAINETSDDNLRCNRLQWHHGMH